uniref:E3 ubiquitin-protein ligase TRIM11-like isoform X1 n=1 Tax=Myxine glutinosa TaxID=7769 RepID=UPI00358F8F63
MATASSSSSSHFGKSLDAPTCTVCLQIYKEPVGLPCGHTFCRVCIEKYWGSREANTACVCPNCREVFAQKPKLKKNVTIAHLVDSIVNLNRRVKSGVNESHCEFCNKEAAKRCVPCEILCCEQHLKPHQHKGHKMVDLGVKTKELRCTEHGKPIQLYCKDDGSLMCLMCTGGKHQNHNVVAVEIAHAELKGVLAARYYPRVSQSMQSVASQLQHVQEEEEKTENSGRDAEDRVEEKRRLVCQFVNESMALMKSQINKRKMEKLSLLGKQREKLEQQMESLRQGKNTMDTALQELKSISFLQGSKDLLNRLETMSDFKSVKTTPLPVLDFSKEKKNLDVLINLNKNFLEKIQKGLVEYPEKVELDHPEKVELEYPEKVDLNRNNLISLYGRTPRLDPNSVHPLIEISRDLRTATRTRTENRYPEHPDRFDFRPQVVSSESFSSGRHYWEVDVTSSSSWRMGICLNSMGRKGGEVGLGENPESWCLLKCFKKYSAHHNNQKIDLSLSGSPERFGFFLDCEAGELTCFGDSRVLHVFRGNFLDPVKAAIGVYGFDDYIRFSSF